MTAAERANSNLIDGKRRKRIALGSGTSVQEVNQVLKQYADMRRMMKQYGNLRQNKNARHRQIRRTEVEKRAHRCRQHAQ